jgi:hypothetical protein
VPWLGTLSAGVLTATHSPLSGKPMQCVGLCMQTSLIRDA